MAAFIAEALVFQPNHVLVLCETSGTYRLGNPCYEPEKVVLPQRVGGRVTSGKLCGSTSLGC